VETPENMGVAARDERCDEPRRQAVLCPYVVALRIGSPLVGPT
jgi:hypothetical protein